LCFLSLSLTHSLLAASPSLKTQHSLDRTQKKDEARAFVWGKGEKLDLMEGGKLVTSLQMDKEWLLPPRQAVRVFACVGRCVNGFWTGFGGGCILLCVKFACVRFETVCKREFVCV
jgi:hypothetical protein